MAQINVRGGGGRERCGKWFPYRIVTKYFLDRRRFHSPFSFVNKTARLGVSNELTAL